MSKNQSGHQNAPCGGFGFSSFLYLPNPKRSLLAFYPFLLFLFTADSVNLVGVTGVEPVTLRLSSACSNQLSYTPGLISRRSLVETRRLELLTYSLQSYRSTN